MSQKLKENTGVTEGNSEIELSKLVRFLEKFDCVDRIRVIILFLILLIK